MTERVVPYLIRMLAPPAGGDHFAIGGAPEGFHAVQRFHELLALFQRQAEQAGGQAVGHTGPLEESSQYTPSLFTRNC